MAQEIERVRSDWLRWYGHLWDFNEVVAWVRLYARAGSIGASLFVTNKRVSKRMVHKRFVWDSWNFLDISVSDNQSSAEIFDDLKNAILAESRRRFKGQRYIDIGVLDVLGPHLDWVALTRRAAPRTELVP
jgi:hypothetical protein